MINPIISLRLIKSVFFFLNCYSNIESTTCSLKCTLYISRTHERQLLPLIKITRSNLIKTDYCSIRTAANSSRESLIKNAFLFAGCFAQVSFASLFSNDDLLELFVTGEMHLIIFFLNLNI